jgi:hypothetical protein
VRLNRVPRTYGLFAEPPAASGVDELASPIAGLVVAAAAKGTSLAAATAALLGNSAAVSAGGTEQREYRKVSSIDVESGIMLSYTDRYPLRVVTLLICSHCFL